MIRVFIDGSAGTTGLRLQERLQSREDITLLSIEEQYRKDPHARAAVMNDADIVFLCLPDDAAREAVTLISNDHTAVIDTSTAHRTAEGWAYGFPELTGQRDLIRNSRRIANPGCHASGAIAILAPLTENGFLSPDAMLTITSLTGYSGGGKKMIAQYEEDNRDPLLEAPRLYGLSQAHKHLPEILKFSHLSVQPVFCPIVAPYYAGMEVQVGLHRDQIRGDLHDLPDLYQSYYNTGSGKSLVHFDADAAENGFMSANAYQNRDDMQISIAGNDICVVVCARFDNLGKGASGAAIQNMNLLIGADEAAGLNV